MTLALGIGAVVACLSVTPAFALSADRTLEQYVHSAWGAEEGYAAGAVYAITQSPDGYLWLGTERGLIRFDGSEFKPIDPALPDRAAEGPVRGLVQDVSGNLWIRLDGPRLLRYHNEVFEDAVSKLHLSEAFFTAMSRNEAGNMLLWGPQSRALRFESGKIQRISPRDQIDGIVISVLESASGAVWLGTRDSGLFEIENGRTIRVLPDTKLRSVNALAPSEEGGVWIGSETGLHLWEHGTSVDLTLPQGLRRAQVYALVRDHHHNLWVGTDDGLYRIDSRSRRVTGVMRNSDETTISSIFEDMEGSIWFAGAHRIERLRDGMFTSFSTKDTSLANAGGPIFVDDAGRTWFAPVSGGLFCIEHGVVKRVATSGLGNDVIYSIDGGKDELWLGRQQGGLTELRRHGGGWQARTYTRRDGLAQNSVYTVTLARDGSVWAGTVSGGVSVLRRGKFQTYTVENGLPSNAIFSSLEGADGKMWFASPGGLVRFDGERWTTYASTDTKQPLNVRTVFEDSSRTLWIGTSQGIARFDHGHIEVVSNLPRVLKNEILGIGQDAQGSLWIATTEHVLQVDPAKLLSQTLSDNDVLSYGADDGLSETKGVRRDRSLVSDSSGRIWLSLPHSIAFADPEEAEEYRQPVAVRIESVSPEGVASASRVNLTLPPDTRSITFRYAGTSMVMPQRTQFRYRLDGLDRTWSTGASSRQVIYTHLAPGAYTFRITASSALGLWNGPEGDIAFSVQPEVWQTWYFRLMSVATAAIVAIVLYRLRMIQVTRRLNIRFHDRLAERTRIAQDLHDTLLQGVISASMQLDVAQDHLSEDSPAKPMLHRVLQLMRQVTEEGRQALRGLRTIDSSAGLEIAFRGMLTDRVSSPDIEDVVQVQGRPRQLKAVVFDEVYRIGREAYTNAVAHAGAARIEIALDYGSRSLVLTVSDNGSGIDAEILKKGREGHWGLSGMRERAKAIGAALTIHSHTPGGTCVELCVPAGIAYPPEDAQQIKWQWRIWKRYSNVRENRENSR
jgi:signal transduction histidine kinase/ligand-binding sensor domain-containing protein